MVTLIEKGDSYHKSVVDIIWNTKLEKVYGEYKLGREEIDTGKNFWQSNFFGELLGVVW